MARLECEGDVRCVAAEHESVLTGGTSALCLGRWKLESGEMVVLYSSSFNEYAGHQN